MDADQTKELICALVLAGWLRPLEGDARQEELGDRPIVGRSILLFGMQEVQELPKHKLKL